MRALTIFGVVLSALVLSACGATDSSTPNAENAGQSAPASGAQSALPGIGAANTEEASAAAELGSTPTEPAEAQEVAFAPSGLNVPGLSDEAVMSAVADIAGVFSCGSRTFKMNPYDLEELNEPYYETTPHELSKADSLNGVTWRGDAVIRAPATRSFREGQWGNWRDRNDAIGGSIYEVRNGIFESIVKLPQDKRLEYSCDTIPAG